MSDPINAITRQEYSGKNAMILAAVSFGYPTPEFLTFKQALLIGRCVRKGEHGTHILKIVEGKPDPTTGKRKKGPRAYVVFNIAQTDELAQKEVADLMAASDPLATQADVDADEARFRAEGAIQNAIAHLGAVEVAPGRYAYQGASTGTWRVASSEHLETVLRNGYRLSPTVFVVGGTKMPSWWTPDSRFAWRSLKGGTVIADALIGEEAKAYCERITADLASGEEVRA